MINRLYIFLAAFLVVLLDQSSKYFTADKLFYGQKISIIKNILSLTKIYNTGAAFSILQNKTILLIFFSAIVTIAISTYFIKKASSLPIILVLAWGLILGGTVGNMLDRIAFRYVIDFIKLDFVNFPIFNLSDIAINAGAFLLLIYHAIIKPEV